MSNMPIEHQEILELIRATDDLLWSSYSEAQSGIRLDRKTRLVFPRTSNGNIRVSEQEAKQLLIQQLQDSRFLFCVETPTTKNYSFSGKGERSAATDLTVLTEDLRPFLNIEFKAKAVSSDRQRVGHITKDLKKLVRESVNGLWHHTLEKAGSNNVTSLWAVIRRELKGVVSQVGEALPPKLLTFHFCVLREAFSVQTTIAIDDCSGNSDWLDNLESPTCKILKRQLAAVTNVEGWSVFHRSH